VNRKGSVSVDQQSSTRIVIKITVPTQSLPAAPARRKLLSPPGNPGRDILDFPKCPIDRKKNEPGKAQVIFWDEKDGRYFCSHGHRFTGRE